ncbi:DUF998 domain-containing protein [Nakamurella leprariae]|uniref:DUF998 domain-containing protein n=1 Tax=Nakamurella leprariae TaxID=2803911 RepID=A0A938Y4Z7_9ACTN|nr:DUF998 domain-containing protein [Nakamurella leprariae]MBM9466156.1 DUF998 domain-containing protein [Nakamurella leprariae]
MLPINDSPGATVRSGARRRWVVASRVCTAAIWVGWLIMQLVSGDWLTPEISMSQYGVGSAGWIFSVWSAALGITVIVLVRASPGVSRMTRVVAWLGLAGALVMAVVRTDPGGAQDSLQAKVHAVGATVALVALLVACVLSLDRTRQPWRAAGWTLGLVSLAAVAFVGVTAFGVDLFGQDSHAAWAFWQGVSVIVDLVLMVIWATAVGRPDRWRTFATSRAGRADRLGRTGPPERDHTALPS